MVRLAPFFRSLPYAALLVLFLTISSLPAAQKIWHFFPEEHLTGITTPAPRPNLPRWGEWKTGQYQKQAEEWWGQWFGGRGALVKTENQMNLSVFRSIASGSNTKIVLGKNSVLYEKAYISTYHSRDVVPTARLEEQIALLKKLEGALRARGKAFVFLLTPSKASIYPEYLPPGFDVRHPQAPLANYERFAALLPDSGLTYIDAHAMLAEQKKKYSFPVFPPGGTHWTYYSACHVSSLLMKRVASQIEKKTPDVVCDPVTVDTSAYGTDKDLAELLNVWQPYPHGQIPHPALSKDTRPELYHPKVVFVGGSFVWTVTGVLDGVAAYRTREFYYYNSRVSRYPGGGELEDFDKENMDWETALKDVDAVVVEANETALSEIGFGFVTGVLASLKE